MWSHLKALCIKRLHYFSKDWMGIIGEIIVPIVFMVIGFLLASIVLI
jgi:hypothetical protein